MAIEISYNRYQLYGKIVLQIIFVFILFIPVYILVKHSWEEYFSGRGLMITVLVVGLFFNTIIMIQLLVLPTGVTVDEESKELTIKFLIWRPVNIELMQMDSWVTTKIFTRSTDYEGLLLNTVEGKKILLSDFNLRNHKPIVAFLEGQKVKCNGNEKFKFFAYYKQAFVRLL